MITARVPFQSRRFFACFREMKVFCSRFELLRARNHRWKQSTRAHLQLFSCSFYCKDQSIERSSLLVLWLRRALLEAEMELGTRLRSFSMSDKQNTWFGSRPLVSRLNNETKHAIILKA